jgi:adenine-specific DNA glycosylase
MKDQIITNKILNWYDINKRSLPWRSKTSSKKKQYYTLVSEFMLQQTQVATVIPYFNRFIKHIPDLETLASFEQALNQHLGALIVLSHDQKFLHYLNIEKNISI